MFQHYFDALTKYARLEGRSTRSAFWYFHLVNLMMHFIIGFIIAFLPSLFMMFSIYLLLTLIPILALGVRRLHDIGKSAWWLFIVLIPFIGYIILFIFLVKKSQAEQNKFDPCRW